MPRKPAGACLAFEDRVKRQINEFRSKKLFRVVSEAGLCVVTDPKGEVCYRALRKGAKGQPWIVMWFNTDHVTWTQENVNAEAERGAEEGEGEDRGGA